MHERGLALVADRALAHLLSVSASSIDARTTGSPPRRSRLARARRGARGAALHHGLAVEVEVEASVQELLQLGRLVEVHRHRARARPENVRQIVRRPLPRGWEPELFFGDRRNSISNHDLKKKFASNFPLYIGARPGSRGARGLELGRAARARGRRTRDDGASDAIGRLVVRAVADAGRRDHALDGRGERASARTRGAGVHGSFSPYTTVTGVPQARVLQELLRERARRVPACRRRRGRAGREQRREQHVDELVRDGGRVEVRLGEDLLDGRLGRERVEERLAARAQRRLDRARRAG